jgi:hypothetical protein
MEERMARKPRVISHWYKAYDGFQISPRDFYAAVEEAVKRREIPDLRMERVNWKEGGGLSDFREYLRITRRRVSFDLCAAPFGTGCFISAWTAEVPPQVLAMVYLLGALIGSWLFTILLVAGLHMPFVVAPLIVVTALYCMGLFVNERVFGDEEAVLWMPLLGPLYERFFHPDTYFKQDAETVFWEFVNGAVMETVEAMTTVKGIRGLFEEHQPVPGDWQSTLEGGAGVPQVA